MYYHLPTDARTYQDYQINVDGSSNNEWVWTPEFDGRLELVQYGNETYILEWGRLINDLDDSDYSFYLRLAKLEDDMTIRFVDEHVWISEEEIWSNPVIKYNSDGDISITYQGINFLIRFHLVVDASGDLEFEEGNGIILNEWIDGDDPDLNLSVYDDDRFIVSTINDDDDLNYIVFNDPYELSFSRDIWNY